MIDKNIDKYDRQAPRQVSKKISRYHHKDKHQDKYDRQEHRQVSKKILRYHHKDKHPDKYQRASLETAMMTNIKEHLDDF